MRMPFRPNGAPPRRRTLAAAALPAAAALLLAACTSGGTTSPAGIKDTSGAQAGGSTAAGGTLHWRPCTLSQTPMKCASLQVPLDYSKPHGRQISLALSMVPATAPAGSRLGDLLVNPGGPGASGLSLAGDVAAGLDPSVAARYNIIGFDPRGVGHSVPALTCQPSFFSGVRPNYIPASKAAEAALVNRAKQYAAGCQQRYGWLLPYLTSLNSARDMDSIRAALGQQQISYFGMSYGTYLGQLYGTVFPHRIKRMILDSTVDPHGIWYADNIAQDYAFQARLEAFFGWVASHNAVFRLGSTRAAVQQAWLTARARLLAHPISGPKGPMIGPDEFDDTFLVGGYTTSVWPGLAAALSAYVRGGATGPMVGQYQGIDLPNQSENQFAVYNAVQCADVNWPRNWAKWNTDTRRVYRTAPYQAWDNAWYNAACAFWPVKGPAQPPQIHGAGLPGILMIQGTLDPATPYQGALAARRLLPSARMVVVPGGGNHVQFFAQLPGGCVTGYVNRYLATGALPPGSGLVNATCPAGPPPSPGG
ncbi:MAG: alpha/beta hydrolase [Gemmatimonadota bacterium]